MLFMTWARQYTPELQAAITDAYNSIGTEIGATVVSVGSAWHQLSPRMIDRYCTIVTEATLRLLAPILPLVCFWQCY